MSEIGKIYMTEELESKVVETEMTVYTALNKRKIYLDRLNKIKAGGVEYLSAVQASAKDVNGVSREEYENLVKSNFDKAVAVIRNFYELNAAITKSNAITEVEIAGDKYTVAEAIVRYDRLNQEIEFLNGIAKNVANAQALITRKNTEMLNEDKVSKHVNSVLQSMNFTEEQGDLQMQMMDKVRTEYIERNTYIMVDPYKHAQTIQERCDSIKEFLSEFNEALNICNMQTIIKVKLIP